jgi:hypothetical protein
LRPTGGAQRAKRKLTPSGVLMLPVTTSSGTGLAGMETSFMVAENEPVRGGRGPYSRAQGGLNRTAIIDLKSRHFKGL